MQEGVIRMPKLSGDVYPWFTGSDEVIARLEREEELCCSLWEKVIRSPFFMGLEFLMWNHQKLVLTKAIQPSAYNWRISYFDDYGAVCHSEFGYQEKYDRSFKSMVRYLATQVPGSGEVKILVGGAG